MKANGERVNYWCVKRLMR
ncbi:hypothetical protein [Microbulbifer sp. ZKSA002]